MKRFILFLITTLFLSHLITAQSTEVDAAFSVLDKRGEVYFKFMLVDSPTGLDQLSKVISIDNVKNNEVFAYANKNEFDQFLELEIPFQVLTAPSMLHIPRMMDGEEALRDREWDSYPTYQGYLDIMNQFTIDHPDLCELVSIGQTNEGRELLCIHINNDLDIPQDEPEFLYTSSIHGDELTGYVVMLRFIDYLLENYGTNDQVTNLVDNIDIWINPLANPDGTYAGGNHTVYGATRGNAYGIDMNRNYPDPEDGDHPDGNPWQTETVHFMDFAGEHNFVMAANFHGGQEVVNYPWDTWYTRHADTDWWELVSHQFADTAHVYSPNGYMTFLDNGVTNGYDWYTISGGRQDYMNYFHHCREVTLEVSDVKLPPANQLPNFWEYLHRSCLNYMEQALYGLRGIVTDASNGSPLAAQVFINSHDEDQSQVYSHLPVGNYHRPIKEGSYSVTFSHAGYYSQTFNNVSPTDEDILILNVQLVTSEVLSADFSADNLNPTTLDPVHFTDLSTGSPNSWLWTFNPSNISYLEGTNETSQNPIVKFNSTGFYSVQLSVSDINNSDTENKVDYIHVIPPPDGPIADFEANVTEGVAPLQVSFTDLSQNEISTWYWDFGNGGWSTQQNPTYTFYTPGIYTVSLSCEGPGGTDTETKIDYISVSEPPPLVDFSADPTSGSIPLTVNFFDLTEGTIDSWLWDFGDGNTSDDQNPVHIYTEMDIYTVSLTATGPGGTETLVKDNFINTSEILNVFASATPEIICEQSSCQLSAYVSGGSGTYTFSWSSDPEGFYSSEQNPLISPEQTTTYTIEVNDGEHTESAQVTVTVNPLPEIVLVDWPEQVCNEQEPPIQLLATPAGGVFEGNHVSPSGVFTPESAGLGWNVITYSYTNIYNCESHKQDSIFVDSCLSFYNEFETTKNAVTVFPNPFEDLIHIKTDVDEMKIKIISLQGDVLISKSIDQYSKPINLEHLDSGVYIFYGECDQFRSIQKIIKR
jgi:PKD repeat protein